MMYEWRQVRLFVLVARGCINLLILNHSHNKVLIKQCSSEIRYITIIRPIFLIEILICVWITQSFNATDCVWLLLKYSRQVHSATKSHRQSFIPPNRPRVHSKGTLKITLTRSSKPKLIRVYAHCIVMHLSLRHAHIIVHKSMAPSMKRNDGGWLSPIAIGSQIKYSITFRRFIGISTNRFLFRPHLAFETGTNQSDPITPCSKLREILPHFIRANQKKKTRAQYIGIVFNVANSNRGRIDWLVHISFNYHASHPLSHGLVQVL